MRPPRTQYQLLIPIGALWCIFFAGRGGTARGSARRREPAVKVRLVDRDLPTGQGKIYPNWPRTTQPHQSEPYSDDEMEASQSVSRMPTRPGKLDPSVHCTAAFCGQASRPARHRRMAASYLLSVAAPRPARHFPLHDCDETTACSSTQLQRIGRQLSSSGKPNPLSYLHYWCAAKLVCIGSALDTTGELPNGRPRLIHSHTRMLNRGVPMPRVDQHALHLGSGIISPRRVQSLHFLRIISASPHSAGITRKCGL